MLHVNAQRLLADMAALAEIGATPEGGVSRPALSPADLAGRDWFRQQVEAAGLTFRQDGAGNVSAILPAADPTAWTLLCGSHLDSVPDGGRFDGALGTLAALEALRTIREARLTLPVHLEAIAFTDEEGELVGLLGSQAVAGDLTPEILAHPRGGRDKLLAGLDRAGLSETSLLGARRDPDSLLAFVEMHIEQGTRLLDAGLDLGVVTAIVGIRSFWLTFTGQAAHAGTTPLARRKDALWGAAEFIGRARDLVAEQFDPGVVNCGILHAAPGAFNIVPGRVRLALEFRHGSEATLDTMQSALLALAENVAASFRLALNIEEASRAIAAPLGERVIAALEAAADHLDLGHTRLLSFAGHDTQVMSRIVPAAMAFVPSVGGLSHNPAEFTPDDDVIHAADVLLHTLLILAEAAR
jgi:hydantoinase/carbamoylase family amidase